MKLCMREEEHDALVGDEEHAGQGDYGNYDEPGIYFFVISGE